MDGGIKMRTFFTLRDKTEVQERNVEAMDIVTEEYHIAVRSSGLLIKRKENYFHVS